MEHSLKGKIARVTGRLEGQVAVVTGAASGIGAGTVRRFLEEGARVVLADVDLDRGKALTAELGDDARFAETDVADEDAVAAAVDLAVAAFGRLDVMFNNAGILGAVGPIAETDAAAWDRSIAVLLRSVFLGMKHAARVMIPQRSGAILSTSSIAGVTGGLGPHGYSACKHAVVGLTKSVAVELAPYGIRVNAIAPGMTVSAMTAFTCTGDPDALDSTTEAIRSRSALGIAGEPLDIANAALYLASDEARYVSGHLLVVDGGQTANGGSRHFASMDAGLVDAGNVPG